MEEVEDVEGEGEESGGEGVEWISETSGEEDVKSMGDETVEECDRGGVGDSGS